MKSRRDRCAEGLGAMALATGILAIGGAPRWAALTTAGLALAGAACFVAARRRSDSELVAFLVAVALVTSLQWIPLPAHVVEVVSHEKYELIRDNARALVEPMPRYLAVSYDRPATLLELSKLISFAAFGVVCVRLAAKQASRRRIILACVMGPCCLAILAIIHQLAGFQSVYGIYTIKQAPAVLLGPVVNPNHLAAVLALAAPVAAGLAMEVRGPRRLVWAGATLLLVGGTLLTRSRGGFLGLTIAAIVAGLLWLLQRSKREPRGVARLPRSTVIAVGVVGICALVLVGASTAGGLLHDLGSTKTSELTGAEGKASIWEKSTPLIGEHLLTGVGRGAFSFAFTRLQPDSRATRTHVENEYLQAVIDWGIPVAGLVGALLILAAFRALRQWERGPVEAGIIAGLIGLAAHSVFDFSLQIPGVTLPAIGLFSVLVPARLGRTTSRTRVITFRVAALLASVALIAAAASESGRQARAESISLQDRKRPGVEASLAAWRRHPADYVLAGVTAQQMLVARDKRSIAVLNRALFLNPTHPTLHAIAARALYAFGKREQSLVELSLALERASQKTPLVDELTTMFATPADAARGVPTGDLGAGLETIQLLQQRGHSDVAELAARRLQDAHPDSPEPWLVLAGLALTRGDSNGARAAAQRAQEIRPDAESAVLLARAIGLGGEPQRAIAMLERAMKGDRIASRADARNAYDALAKLCISAGDLDGAHANLVQMLSLTSNLRQRAEVHRRLARLEQLRGNRHQAEIEWNRAKSQDGEANRRRQ